MKLKPFGRCSSLRTPFFGIELALLLSGCASTVTGSQSQELAAPETISTATVSAYGVPIAYGVGDRRTFVIGPDGTVHTVHRDVELE